MCNHPYFADTISFSINFNFKYFTFPSPFLQYFGALYAAAFWHRYGEPCSPSAKVFRGEKAFKEH
jgi:hypothetical protein